MKLYVATSWSNPRHRNTIEVLRACGHECYDFKASLASFSWDSIFGGDQHPSIPQQFLALTESSDVERAFTADKIALDWAEAGVLILPAGRSAHLEAGYLIGQGKPVYIMLVHGERPDVLHLLATRNRLCSSASDVVECIASERVK